MNSTNASSAALKWDVFTIKRPGLSRDLPPGKEELQWVANSSTLIYGERDAVLVDTFLTIEQSQALVNWVVASGKNLTAVYLTHGHGDHFFGLAPVLERFPNARAVATKEVVRPCTTNCRQRRWRCFGANFSQAKLLRSFLWRRCCRKMNSRWKDTNLSR